MRVENMNESMRREREKFMNEPSRFTPVCRKALIGWSGSRHVWEMYMDPFSSITSVRL